MIASVVKDPTMVMVTLLCGRVLSERALRLLLREMDASQTQKRLFVHNSVCSKILEGLFAILAECSQFCLRAFNRNSRGNPSICWLGGGGLRGAKIVNKHFVNKLAFP